MTGTLSFREAKPGLIRGLVEERVDPVLFRMSYNYVGDLAGSGSNTIKVAHLGLDAYDLPL